MPASQPGPEGDEADDLAAKDADLKKIGGLEFLQQPIPQDVKGVFSEAAAMLLKVGAVVFELGRKQVTEIANALEIKRGGFPETAVPIGSFEGR